MQIYNFLYQKKKYIFVQTFMSYFDIFITQSFKILASQKIDGITKYAIAYLEKKAVNIFETTRMYPNIIDKVSLNQDKINGSFKLFIL